MVPRPSRVLPSCVLAGLALFVGVTPGTSLRSAAAEAEVDAAVGERLDSLRSAIGSPVAAVRVRAGRELEEALAREPALARPLLATWAQAGARERELVGRALLRRGDKSMWRDVLRATFALSDVDAHPLLRAWAQDEPSARALGALAAADAASFADPLAWGLGSSKEAARLAALVELVARSEIEGLLTSRKSPTGHTGYYRGQYAVLAAHPRRTLVLDVLAGIGLDEQLPFPRAVGLGPYAPVLPQDVRFYEWRGMALSALSEIATPDDDALLMRLEIWYRQHLYDALETRERLIYARSRSRFLQEDASRIEERLDALGELVGQAADVLTTIYSIAPTRTADALDRFLGILEDWPPPAKPIELQGMVAQVLIRTGRYAEAIQEYRRDMRLGGLTTKSLSWYNQACAFSCWSRDPGEESAEALRRQALSCLEQAYNAGWRDLGWMEEDGDLDPIRNTPRYQQLRARMQAELDALLADPDDPDAALPGERPARLPAGGADDGADDSEDGGADGEDLGDR